MSLSIVLLHHPMVDKRGDVATTSITNLDLHDIARVTTTYDLHGYWVVHPVATQRYFAERVLKHWREGWGSTYNATRKQALERLHLVSDLDQVADALEADLPDKTTHAKFIATTAKRLPNAISFPAFRDTMAQNPHTPYCLVFGTGWGLHPLVYEDMDGVLEPISGLGDWNHLSVRSAVSIIVDRLCGRSA